MIRDDMILGPDDCILVTGANGFIGSRVVKTLLEYGFRNIRCFVRPSSDSTALRNVLTDSDSSRVEFVKGNLLSREDCRLASEGVSLILHLAAGIEKTFPGCFLNSVVTTRNLLDATLEHKCLKRFVNVSSFSVYSTFGMKGNVLDETCEVEQNFRERAEAYCFGKAKQDELVLEYNRLHQLPYAIVRPGAVYGPGKSALTARAGIGTFGIFLHLGGSNRLPLTYVDNCAEVIVLAGLVAAAHNEIINVVDNDLPTSRRFLRLYKKSVGHFRSLYVPYWMFYIFSSLWESYSRWSRGQLPPVFNRRRCAAYWRRIRYSNEKATRLLGWDQRIPFSEGARRYFDWLQTNANEREQTS